MTKAVDGRSVRERMLAGDVHVFDDPQLAEENAAALDPMAAYNATTARQEPLRRAVLERLLGSVGDETVLGPPWCVDDGSHVHIGARTFANFGLVALDVAPITIGDNVRFGCGVVGLPGVVLDENTVAGAGSVVTKDLPADVVAVGNPARVVRAVDDGASATGASQR